VSAAVVDLLRELDRHHIQIVRNGDRLKLKGAANIPPELVARARALKPELVRYVPDEGARPVVRFRLPDHGDAWASAIGAPGDTKESLIADLRMRWPAVEVQA
jgi:hypothetical protein